MKTLQINNQPGVIENIVPIEAVESSASNLRFINANTLAMPIEDLRSNHHIFPHSISSGISYSFI